MVRSAPNARQALDLDPHSGDGPLRGGSILFSQFERMSSGEHGQSNPRGRGGFPLPGQV